MRDEIERIQSQKQDENNDEVDESNISELQKLVDEDSEAESSEDDWKVEGRKLSEDQTKGALNLLNFNYSFFSLKIPNNKSHFSRIFFSEILKFV